jgi:hypothetical protein
MIDLSPVPASDHGNQLAIFSAFGTTGSRAGLTSIMKSAIEDRCVEGHRPSTRAPQARATQPGAVRGTAVVGRDLAADPRVSIFPSVIVAEYNHIIIKLTMLMKLPHGPSTKNAQVN